MNMKKPPMPKAEAGAKAGMSMPRFGARAMRPGGMAKGGKVHEDAAMDRKLIRQEYKKLERAEERKEGKEEYKRGGAVKKGKK